MNIAHIITIALLGIGGVAIVVMSIKTEMVYREIDKMHKNFMKELDNWGKR